MIDAEEIADLKREIEEDRLLDARMEAKYRSDIDFCLDNLTEVDEAIKLLNKALKTLNEYGHDLLMREMLELKDVI